MPRPFHTLRRAVWRYAVFQRALSGTKMSISYAGCKLSGPELDRIYTNLATIVSVKYITITKNWGTADDTPSIATAKGPWTFL